MATNVPLTIANKYEIAFTIILLASSVV